MPQRNKSRRYRNGQPLVTVANYQARRQAFNDQERAQYESVMKTRRKGKQSPEAWREVEREAVEIVVMSIGAKESRPVDQLFSTDGRWQFHN